MKTYALEYKNPNTMTFKGVILSDEEIEALADKNRQITVDEKRQFMEMAKDKMFKPGINEVTEKELQFLKKHPSFDALFDLDPPHFEWVRGKGPEDFKGTEANILGGLTDKEALKIVKNTLDKDILLKWLEQEKKDTILKAVKVQLDKLVPKARAA